MAIGIGAASQLAIGKETAWGTAVTPTLFIEFLEESMKNEVEHIEAGFIMGSRNNYKYYKGSEDVKGSFSMVVNPDNIGLLLYTALGVEGDATEVELTTAYDHDFTPAGTGTDLGSVTIEVDRDITCCTYAGATVDNFGLTAAKGSLVTANFDIIAQSETDDETATAGLSPSSLLPYMFHHGTVEVDAGAVAYVNSFNFTYGNGLDADGGFILNGSRNRAHAYKQGGILTGSMELEWTSDSDVLRDAYLDNTQKQLTLVLTSTEIIEAGYYYTLTVDIPKVHIMGDPPVISTRDRTPFTVNFEAVYDSTNFVKITARDARTTKWSA